MDTTNQAQELILRTLELGDEARASFLEEACGDNSELRAEVERQLAKSKQVDSFFAENEVATIRGQRPTMPVMEREGDRVGPYVLRQKIGEGGFGYVWMAEQTDELSRMVAVKVVKAGMDTKEVLNRFEAERQALAMMDHPNIARVFDAGSTESGRLYFAMELIKGIPITKFCDQQKLNTSQRLELFKHVCSAVSHAHQKGIIHRDLKPSNVMVTLHGDQPVVKIIDFGIAKATHSKLTDKTLFTRFEQFLGTPAYMSPEQAAMSGLDIDTRSDVYSLGILLYELLAGKPPFEQSSLVSAGYDEMRRIIAEDEPPMPSKQLTSLREESISATSGQAQVAPSELRGDLDWIVMKAIEKDRSRRYGTANAFAADIDRYLIDEPVEAAAPNPVYKLKKFARRNRAVLGTAVAFVVLLLVGITTTTSLALRAIREKENAIVAEELAEQRLRESEAARKGEAELTKAKKILGFQADVTPASILKALDEGLFAYPLEENHPPERQPRSWGGAINLMTSVRGEAGQETLYSPVLELLKAVATSADPAELEELDSRLDVLCHQRGYYRVEALVAATAFSYERRDFETATRRLESLENVLTGPRLKPGPFEPGLWLVAQSGLAFGESRTRMTAKLLADRAISATEKYGDLLTKKVILRERAELLQAELTGQEAAENAIDMGDLAKAREILRMLPNIGSYKNPSFGVQLASDSDAAASFKLAALLQERSDFDRAAEAYLAAYRLAPRLFDSEHLSTIKQARRTSELVEIFTVANVKKLDKYSYTMERAVVELLKDEETRSDGNRLLKRLWSEGSRQNSLINYKPERLWDYVPDPGYYVRSKLIPVDIDSEGAGWARFKIEGFYELSEEPGFGFPLSLRPLLRDKAAMRKLAREVETKIEQHSDWKAGPAVLAYLEAEVGNYQRATELLGQVLKDAEIRPIPSDSAWVFGMALEGKNADLDRQVMRLYESSLRNRPARISRLSAIPKLAQLNAKYDQLLEARRLLHQLATVNYNPDGSSVICSSGRKLTRCSDCHSGRSNLLDYCVMSNNLTDIGYPVDSLISLARIDASFSNAYGSDDAWVQKAIPVEFYTQIERGRTEFVPAKNAAIDATTPQAVLEALKSGVFSGRDMTKPAVATSDIPIALMLSVRGEGRQSSVFSPVIDVLKLAVESKESGAGKAITDIDERLNSLSEANPTDIQTLVAATAFAFLRNDLQTAVQRVEKLQKLSSTPNGKPTPENKTLWLAARYALKYEQTRSIGEVLTERALVASGEPRDLGINDAILREFSGIRPG